MALSLYLKALDTIQSCSSLRSTDQGVDLEVTIRSSIVFCLREHKNWADVANQCKHIIEKVNERPEIKANLQATLIMSALCWAEALYEANVMSDSHIEKCVSLTRLADSFSQGKFRRLVAFANQI